MMMMMMMKCQTKPRTAKWKRYSIPVHPVSDRSTKLSSQRSHVRPVTWSLQMHWPVVWSHTALVEPTASQPQSGPKHRHSALSLIVKKVKGLKGRVCTAGKPIAVLPATVPQSQRSFSPYRKHWIFQVSLSEWVLKVQNASSCTISQWLNILKK